VLRQASCMLWGECEYNRIDLETYGSCAATLGGSLGMSHTLKYYRRRKLPAHGSTPETTHVLRHASCMMWGECGYDRIDLETYGSCAVTLGRLSHTQILQTQEAPSSQQ
jgi:tRNA G26 N,N-dimethylase Trm1